MVAVSEAHRSEGGAMVLAAARGSPPLVGHAREQMRRVSRRSVRLDACFISLLHQETKLSTVDQYTGPRGTRWGYSYGTTIFFIMHKC